MFSLVFFLMKSLLYRHTQILCTHAHHICLMLHLEPQNILDSLPVLLIFISYLSPLFLHQLFLQASTAYRGAFENYKKQPVSSHKKTSSQNVLYFLGITSLPLIRADIHLFSSSWLIAYIQKRCQDYEIIYIYVFSLSLMKLSPKYLCCSFPASLQSMLHIAAEVIIMK